MASLIDKRYKAKITAIFAKPNLIPGIGKKEGIWLSTNDKIIAKAIINAEVAIFLFLICP